MTTGCVMHAHAYSQDPMKKQSVPLRRPGSRSLTASLLLAGTLSTQAQVFNPGFESPVFRAESPVGSWFPFQSNPQTGAAHSLDFPRSGNQSLLLSILGVPDSFAGVVQEIRGLAPGVQYTFSGWHAAAEAPIGVQIEIRIEWRNSVTDTEVASTPNFSPVSLGAYDAFAITAEVPADANAARLVLAVQSFLPGDVHTGSFHFDDVSFAPIPEPATYALMAGTCLMGFALLRRRNRRTG